MGCGGARPDLHSVSADLSLHVDLTSLMGGTTLRGSKCETYPVFLHLPLETCGLMKQFTVRSLNNIHARYSGKSHNLTPWSKRGTCGIKTSSLTAKWSKCCALRIGSLYHTSYVICFMDPPCLIYLQKKMWFQGC